MIVCVADPRPVYANILVCRGRLRGGGREHAPGDHALGYASVWLDGALRAEDRAARIGRLLGVPAGRTVRILLPLGVPAEPGQQQGKTPLRPRAWFNRYG